MKSCNLNQSGFSLVETLVAITILLVVVVGPMTISTSTARSTSFSSEQVVAFFLAQEGAEIAQMVRDGLVLDAFSSSGNAWDSFTDETGSGLLNECYTPSGCSLELNTDTTGSLNSVSLCSGNNCRLYEDTSSARSKYTHSSVAGDTTPYTRSIRMNNINADEVEVVSTVSWQTGNQRDVQQVSVETHLFNVYGI
jgi:prepilin-type N-terminal cleavage/methylation domain-containing protein